MKKINGKMFKTFAGLTAVVFVMSMFALNIYAVPASGFNWDPLVTHSHSTYSQWADGSFASWTVDGILKDLDKNLVDGACNISDHVGESNITMPWTDPAFIDTDSDGDGHYIIPVRGEEWGTKVDTNGDGTSDTETGHATVFNVDPGNNTPILVRKVLSNGQIAPDTYENLINDVTARGALVWANHPCNSYPWLPKVQGWTVDANGDGDYNDPGDWLSGLEGRMIGTEVWTWTWSQNNNQAATDWWQSLLAQGKRKVVGIAGSDFHNNQTAALLGPCDLVYANSTSPADLETALKNGKVIMRKGDNSTPMIILEADADGDGNYETMVGDTIAVTGTKTINFRIKCYNTGSSDHIRIFTNEGWVDPGNPNIGDQNWLSAGSGTPWTYVFSKTFSANEKNFVRVELRQSWLTDYAMDAMTNPIYINVY